MSVPQVMGIRGRAIEQPWPSKEPSGEQAPAIRTALDVLLDVCRGLEDPEFHDGWQPVRARSEAPRSE
jgi:hypothetical protein